MTAAADRTGPPERPHLRAAPPWQLAEVLVRDVMTHEVISVTEQAPFKEMVEALSRYQVSALPVVDHADRVVGMVSESDLLAKLAVSPGSRPRVLSRRGRNAPRRRTAETAADLMTAPTLTVRAGDTVAHTARRMTALHLRRAPVVDAQGMLIGIVTRSDLLRVFLRSDADISHHLSQVILGERFGIQPGSVDLQVHNGVVTLSGEVERRWLIPELVGAVGVVAGVVAVHHDLSYRVDDTAWPIPSIPVI